MNEKKSYIHEWILKISKQRPELGGLSVCPYAASSKNLIIETSIDDIAPKFGYDVIIFIVEDSLTLKQIKDWVYFYNEKFPKYTFLEDCASKKTFINEIQTNNAKYNLILCQLKSKLTKFRKQLAKTDYYSYWDDEYLKEILENDYTIIKNGDSNPLKSSNSTELGEKCQTYL